LVAGQFDVIIGQFQIEPVKNGHRQHQHFQLVKAVVTPANDVEQQVDFAVRFTTEFHDKKGANREAGAKEIAEQRLSGQTP